MPLSKFFGAEPEFPPKKSPFGEVPLFHDVFHVRLQISLKFHVVDAIFQIKETLVNVHLDNDSVLLQSVVFTGSLPNKEERSRFPRLKCQYSIRSLLVNTTARTVYLCHGANNEHIHTHFNHTLLFFSHNSRAPSTQRLVECLVVRGPVSGMALSCGFACTLETFGDSTKISVMHVRRPRVEIRAETTWQCWG